MKKLVLVIALLLILSTSVFALNTFSDVDKHWSKDWVNDLVSRNITSGYPDGTFKPNNTVSIEEFITFTIKALQSIDPAKYKTISSGGYWSDQYINKAIDLSIISVGQFDNFRRSIKREEMAYIIIKAYGLENTVSQSSTNSDVINKLQDYYLVNDFYKNNMLIAVKDGFISGKSELRGKIVVDPLGTATRGEASVLLIKLLDADKRTPLAIDRPSTTFIVEEYRTGYLVEVPTTYYAPKNYEGKYVTEIFDITNYFEAQNHEKFNANWLVIGERISIDFICNPKYEAYYTGQFWFADKIDLMFDFRENSLDIENGYAYSFNLFVNDRVFVDYDTFEAYIMGEYGEQFNYFCDYFFKADANAFKTLIFSSIQKGEAFSGKITLNGRNLSYYGGASSISIYFTELTE